MLLKNGRYLCGRTRDDEKTLFLFDDPQVNEIMIKYIGIGTVV